MELLTSVSAISDILAAVFVPKGAGAPIHKNRVGDGIAYNPDCTSVYTFENGKSYTCGHGQCIYLPRGSSYTVKKPSAEKHSGGVYAINFLVLNNESSRPWVRAVKMQDEMLTLFSSAAREWTKKSEGYYEECMSDLYRIIWRLKNEAARSFTARSTSPSGGGAKSDFSHSPIPMPAAAPCLKHWRSFVCRTMVG